MQAISAVAPVVDINNRNPKNNRITQAREAHAKQLKTSLFAFSMPSNIRFMSDASMARQPKSWGGGRKGGEWGLHVSMSFAISAQGGRGGPVDAQREVELHKPPLPN